jgi:putative endonuclease
MVRGGCVYIMTNKHHTTLYIGVTSDIVARVLEHKEKTDPKSFTARYNLFKLVYYELLPGIEESIAREKQLKAGSRKRKIDLINSMNPEWKDLFEAEVKNW